jgi:hypothetical protein
LAAQILKLLPGFQDRRNGGKPRQKHKVSQDELDFTPGIDVEFFRPAAGNHPDTGTRGFVIGLVTGRSKIVPVPGAATSPVVDTAADMAAGIIESTAARVAG